MIRIYDYKLKWMILLILIIITFTGCSVKPTRESGETDRLISLRFYREAKEGDPDIFSLKIEDTGTKILLNKKPALNEKDVSSAELRVDVAGFYSIFIIFTEEGKKKLEDFTQRNINKRFGIVIDGRLVTAPIIKQKITEGKAVIIGRFSKEEAKAIIDRINKSIMGR